MIFLNAYISKQNETKSALLKSAIEKQFESVADLSFGPEYLTKLNPNMIMFCLKFLPDRVYKEIILEKVLDICPGLIDGWLMLGNIQSNKKAHKSLEKVLELDPTNSEAHLMIANLLIKQVIKFFIHCIFRGIFTNVIFSKKIFEKWICRNNLQMHLKVWTWV